MIKKKGTPDKMLVNECGTIPPEEEAIMPDEVGSVGMSCGGTVNMGNFESARVDCWCTLPCTEKSAEDQYKKCYEFVTGRVEEHTRAKIEERQSK